MTIGGALSELNNLLNADDIPCYYKPSIKAVMDTIALEQEPKSEWQKDHEILKAYSDGAEVSDNSVLEDIKVEMENLKDNRCFCHHYERGINECINVLNKHMESEDNK